MKLPLLLTLLSLTAAVEKREQKCYGNLGCFSSMQGFKSIPEGPDVIKTEFLLFTRHNKQNAIQIPAADEKDWNSHLAAGKFSVTRETKVIVHGFLNSGATDWIQEMKDALLKQSDYNVFVVDWGHGSKPPYDQAAANTFLVSAQLSRFLLHLKNSNHADLRNMHLIGHSLGAQICGNTGAATRGIARITGLDPAEPDFLSFSNSHRLDKSDASFVDVIHTDGEKFNVVKGYGMMQPCGHIDFYPNGGQDQPGCSDSVVGGLLGQVFGNGKGISCSHGRALQYFTESIDVGGCRFTAHPCKDWATYETGTCHGCPSAGCPIMGYEADKTSLRGSFYLSTDQASPYCGHEYFVEIDMSAVDENAYGRLYITLTGSKGSSGEIEFTREYRHYHKSDHEKHVVAVPKDLGSLTQVKVKYEKGRGLAAAGASKEVIFNRVLVRNADTSHQDKFCIKNAHLEDGESTTLTSHSGC